MCDINVHTDTTVPSGKSREAKVRKLEIDKIILCGKDKA